jgi:tRNA (adenine57-N1/adenine58-N1)-methyltransferase catalytic subunit
MKALPELLNLAMSQRRTAIVQPKDAAMIVYELGLKPGCTVIESGTGSGVLSRYIHRCVAPDGHLYTFEAHPERAAAIRLDFERDGVRCVTVGHRDVYSDGFGELDALVDAVMLDLPQPWKAVGHAHAALRVGGRLCSYSPCIEQVQRICSHLRAFGFADLVTMELFQRTIGPTEPSNAMAPIDFNRYTAQGTVVLNGDDKQPAKRRRASVKEGDIVRQASSSSSLSSDRSKPMGAKERQEAQLERERLAEPLLYRYNQTAVLPLPNRGIVGHTSFLTFCTRT